MLDDLATRVGVELGTPRRVADHQVEAAAPAPELRKPVGDAQAVGGDDVAGEVGALLALAGGAEPQRELGDLDRLRQQVDAEDRVAEGLCLRDRRNLAGGQALADRNGLAE